MNWKQFLQNKDLSSEEYAKKSVEEMASLQAEYQKSLIDDLNSKVDKASTKTDVEAVKTSFETYKAELEDLQIKESLEEFTEKIAILEEKTSNSGLDERKTIREVLEANKDAVIEAFKNGKTHEFTVKATATTASVTDNSAAQRENDISPLAVKKLSIYDLFRKVRVGRNNNGTVTYYDWDEATTARAAAMVSEGGTFPESTAAWIEYAIKLKKIGDSIPVTEEFKYDTAMFADELRSFLEVNVKLEEDSQLLSGDNTGNNLAGLDFYAPAYVPVASGIADASHYDLAVKVAEDITKGKGNKFRPNFMLANLTEINKMRLKKDANNNYVMPPFVDRNGNVVAGITVVEDNGLADNTLIIGDNRYGKIYEDEDGYTFSTALVNNQFLTDQETLKARKRVAFLIRNSEKAGFRKVTDVAAALTTLAGA